MSDSDDRRAPSLQRLRDAGFDLSLFSDEQVEVLSMLSDEEVSVLLDIKERLGDPQPDVLAHDDAQLTIGGMLF
jgi:hypothetical protein